ncbi:hypothetical protein FHW83_002075 [Duganella sp. SG902]|uniref:Ig-like domain-containing protein n=1 Tax=Duganella sp. SG902 TaxID=2587016 RepID=UPI00159E6C56|nr:Ig-like domain-containing protein [Duganella sp. SG902]NVM76280.1 hypothetical protein [Duganella sp. SG902]
MPSTSTQNRLTFTGQSEPNAWITLYDGDDMVGMAITDANGNWRVTSDKLANGLHAFSVTATDVAGNVSDRSPSTYVNVAAPADTPPKTQTKAPAEVQLDFESDSGASSTDHITNVTLPVYVGKAKPGSFVELVIDGVKGKFAVPVDANGNWQASGETLTDGVHTISVIEHDSNGDTSTPSSPLQLTIDTTAPISTMALVPEEINGDQTTIHTTTANFTGTAEAGTRVDIYESDYFGVTKIGSVVAGQDGTWSFTAAALVDGWHTMLAQVQDLAGNITDSDVVGFFVDTNAPLLQSDTGISGDRMTNLSTPIIANFADPGTRVVLYEGNKIIGTGVADTQGIWRITTTPLADGKHSLVAHSTDKDGNALPVSGTLVLTVDTQGPQTISTRPLLDSRDDHGSSSSDQITNVSTLVVYGTTEADNHASVRVYVDGVEQYLKAGVSDTGAWYSVLYGLSDGAHRIRVTTTDQAGNVGALSTESVIIVDTKAPDAPDVPVLASLPTSATPRLTGVTEAGATVTLYDGAKRIGSAVADDQGAWNITASTLADGAHSLTITVTDVAGNTSAASAALSVTVAAATAPTAPDLLAASDKGASSSDNLTSLATPTITGKAAAGTTVLLFDGATQIGTAVASANGVWSVTTGKLAEGKHYLSAVTQDSGGLLSAPSSQLLVTIDTGTSVSAPVLAALSDTGRSQSDGITNVTTPKVSGTAEAGATVTLYDGSTVVGTAVADDKGAWSITSKALAAGAHSLTAKATDTAGNVSTAPAALAVTIDVKAPSAPTALDLAVSADNGASNSDNLTSITAPVVSGKAEANAIVALYDGDTLLGTALADKNGAWSITSSVTLADGVHSLTAKATDVAGNVSLASPAFKLTVDTATAAPTLLDLATASDKGASTSDNITNLTTPVITGKAEAGATVVLFDGAKQVGKATADNKGVWSITSTKLADGEHHLTAAATDAAGNVSLASAELVLTVDTRAVLVASAPLLDTLSDSGRSQSDGITNVTTPKVSGVTEAGASVALYDGNTLVGTALAGDDGNWSITSKALPGGAHKLTIKVTDIAGNVSSASPVLALTLDNKAPAVPTALDLPAIYDSGAAGSDNKTAISTPVISGKAEADAIVTLYDGDTLLGSALADHKGAWSIATTAPLATGAHSLTAKATDIAGNVSAASAKLNLIIDPGATGLTLAGTSAADSFVLNSEAGAIKVSGFSAAGGDHLLLGHDYNGLPLNSAADVLALGHVDGKNFVINLGAGHEVTLVGVASLAESAILLT